MNHTVRLPSVLGDGSGDELQKLQVQLKDAKTVVFDCAGVQRINSLGAGKWIEFLRTIPAGVAYSFENCPPVFVGYVNAVRPFRGKGAVASFQVPWHCAHCDRSFLVTAKPEADRKALEATTCKTCSRPATSETDLDYYLGFLD